MQRLLITGASGFIGQHVLSLLHDSPMEIHGITRQVPKSDSRCYWHQCDLLEGDPINLIRTIEPTHFLHLAWDVTPNACWASKMNHVWYQASMKLIDAFKQHGGQRVVVCGTCAEYHWAEVRCVEEETPLLGDSDYALYKIKLCEYLKKQPLSWGWARPFWVYGPGEPPEKIISSTVRNLSNNLPAVCQNPQLHRDLIYVTDVANGLIKLLFHHDNGIVNLGSGKPVSLLNVMQQVGKYLKYPDLIQAGEHAEPVENQIVVADTHKMENWLGCICEVPLQDGIIRTIEYALSGRMT